jgi:hypothetical protein
VDFVALLQMARGQRRHAAHHGLGLLFRQVERPSLNRSLDRAAFFADGTVNLPLSNGRGTCSPRVDSGNRDRSRGNLRQKGFPSAPQAGHQYLSQVVWVG